jgi:hypothetical protein
MTTFLVAGSVAARPGCGGHAAAFLQWVLGLRALGHDVWFVDRMPPGSCTDDDGRPCLPVRSRQWAYLEHVCEAERLTGRYVLLADGECLGAPVGAVRHAARGAVLLNVNGYLEDEDILNAVSQRVYVDIDPGFAHFWLEHGLHDAFAGHDTFVTIGERVGQPDCPIPTNGRSWITTPPPVYLPAWPRRPPMAADLLTSVATWRGPFAPVEHDGVRYGLRVHEFRRFVELARRIRARLEIALDIDPADAADIEMLTTHGWHLVDPVAVACDPRAYARYLRRSAAEFCVAKEIYVRTRSGWVSDRSICYLASGRPVIAQDTGWSARYGSSEGFVAFDELDDAVDAARDVLADYERHSKAAYEIAADCFSTTTVLPRLLDALGAT